MPDKPDLKAQPPATAEQARAMKAKKRTPEQAARFAEVSARQRVMQERGVPAPKSGTFGKPAK